MFQLQLRLLNGNPDCRPNYARLGVKLIKTLVFMFTTNKLECFSQQVLKRCPYGQLSRKPNLTFCLLHLSILPSCWRILAMLKVTLNEHSSLMFPVKNNRFETLIPETNVVIFLRSQFIKIHDMIIFALTGISSLV